MTRTFDWLVFHGITRPHIATGLLVVTIVGVGVSAWLKRQDDRA